MRVPHWSPALAATALAAGALGAAAQELPERMADAEILSVASGRTTIGTFADRPLGYVVYVAPDGRLIGRISDGVRQFIETGIWRVQNNQLCGRWDNLRNGEEHCFTYHPVGSNVHAYNTDGTLDRIQYFVDGDPFNLAQIAAGIADETSDLEVVRSGVERWMSLWNAGSEPINPQRFEQYRPIFAAAPHQYLAVDDFTGEVLVLRGYEEYAQTWAPVMADFARWNIVLVGDIDIDFSGDNAIAMFTFRGDGELASGEAVGGLTYATLVWRRFGDEWRIVHEHLTNAE